MSSGSQKQQRRISLFLTGRAIFRIGILTGWISQSAAQFIALSPTQTLVQKLAHSSSQWLVQSLSLIS
jgi:hypothetical protein